MTIDSTMFNDELDTVIRLLVAEGQTQAASDINGAYKIAGTGNEAISGIYFYLRQVNLDLLSDTTRKRIESYKEFLKKKYPKLCSDT